MSIALYRKYRSKSLDEIVGQSHVTDVLRRALAAGKIAHAYLLTGPRGVGKTSIARILAHEINGLDYTDESEHLDIIEIDAASNNGIDDVRELREKALIAPAVAKKKIYIIDEVHMLSKPAFNALLKILEEPPAHIVFILATTDFDKLPDTIVSRTQRYHFHTITEEEVVTHLATIAQAEHIAIEPTALEVLAQRGGGSLRDSISLLDQIQHAHDGKGDVTRVDVEKVLGLTTLDELTQLIASLQNGNAQHIIANIQSIQRRGVSASTLASQLAQTLTSQLAAMPALVHLLEGLLEVPKSPHPDTKLLITLLSGVVEKPKTVAQAVHTPKPVVTIQPTSPAPASTPQPPRATPKQPTASAVQEPAPEYTSAGETLQPEPAGEADLSKFDWEAILSYAQQHHSALYALIAKCTPEVKTDKIVLYTGRKFNKTKLESAKNRPIIGQILAETGVGAGADVEFIGEPAPPKDSQAAKVAAMMGGGEEVDVE